MSRNVVVSISTKLSGGDDAFKKMGDSARKTQGDVKGYLASIDHSLKVVSQQLSGISQGFRGMGQAAQQGAAESSAAFRRLEADVDRFNRKVKASEASLRAAGAGTGSRGGRGGGGGLGAAANVGLIAQTAGDVGGFGEDVANVISLFSGQNRALQGGTLTPAFERLLGGLGRAGSLTFDEETREEREQRLARERWRTLTGSDSPEALGRREDELRLRRPGLDQRFRLEEDRAAAGREFHTLGTDMLESERQLEQTTARIQRVELSIADTLKEKADLKRSNRLTLADELDIEDRLRQLGQRRLELERQSAEQSRATHRERIDLLKREKEGVEQIVKSEQDRLKSMGEQFALMSPMDRRESFDIAQRLQSGQPLTREQAEFARSNTGLFQQPLQQAAQTPEVARQFEQFIRATGQDKKLREAEALKLQVQQKIDFAINLQQQDIGNQLRNELLPKIQEALDRIGRDQGLQIRQFAAEEVGRLLDQLRANRQPLFGGQ